MEREYGIENTNSWLLGDSVYLLQLQLMTSVINAEVVPSEGRYNNARTSARMH